MDHIARAQTVLAGVDSEAVAHALVPIGMLLAVLLTIAIAGGGGALVLWLWFSSRRDPRIAAVPRRLKTPPSTLPAPVAGTLVDGVAGGREVVAALLEMADRGLIHVTDAEGEGGRERHELAGFGIEGRLTLKVNPGDTRTRAYERTLLDALFGPSAAVPSEVLLSDATQRLAAVLPTVEAQLYAAAADAGFCVRNPRFARQLGYGASTDTIVFGIACVVAAAIWLQDMLPVAAMPGLALAGVGLVGLAIATWLPPRTALGEYEAARWRAFRTYLAEAVAAAPPATDVPAHYLPYAVAFGIETAISRPEELRLRRLLEAVRL